jgi:putative Mg2+ transporter-C (MgtC) family protein
MNTSMYPSFIPNAGLTYRQTINESDKQFYWAALDSPAAHASIVLAFAGDDIDKAVQAHPEHLRVYQRFHSPNQGWDQADATLYVTDTFPGVDNHSALNSRPRPVIASGRGSKAKSCSRHGRDGRNRHDRNHPCQFGSVLLPARNLGDLEQQVVSNEAVKRLLVACALGALVGIEREWKGQSAGVRTNLLICLACAFFTLMSAVLAGDNGPTKARSPPTSCRASASSAPASSCTITTASAVWPAPPASGPSPPSAWPAAPASTSPPLIATVIVSSPWPSIGFLEWPASLRPYPLIYEARGSDRTNMLSPSWTHGQAQLRLAGVRPRHHRVTPSASAFLSATSRQHKHLRTLLLAEPASAN